MTRARQASLVHEISPMIQHLAVPHTVLSSRIQTLCYTSIHPFPEGGDGLYREERWGQTSETEKPSAPIREYYLRMRTQVLIEIPSVVTCLFHMVTPTVPPPICYLHSYQESGYVHSTNLHPFPN